MRIYQVGGAVRDRLLGLPVQDRDWVVVGATPEDLLRRGFKQVGRDFPVFLHPETGEEYALARTERKAGRGHRGFVVHSAPDVTLEEDLARRDLTINAMALAEDGSLVDPYGGRRDLERRLLRHVSPAFAEDPLRVLRVARFAARLAPLGFRVAPETLDLMRRMSASGELETLSPERVWQELVRALGEARPSRFLAVLRGVGALRVVLPEVDRLFGVPQPRRHHPEIDTGVHTLLVLDRAAALGAGTEARFAALVHDLGKGETPPARWPSHRGHEERGARLVTGLCRRLRAPRAFQELGELVARHHTRCHRLREARPGTVLELLEALDLFRRPGRLAPFLQACQADAQGRPGFEDRPYPQAALLEAAHRAAAAVAAAELLREGLRGPALGEALRRRRLAAVAQALRSARSGSGPSGPGPNGPGPNGSSL
ncbi:MAG: multifunctional CCA addition/repair protein [Gammaproteobacteria bacterium]|nr:MAG: multifunctional CCA addition/repair protein [Gammaproteobacteria bacterium]